MPRGSALLLGVLIVLAALVAVVGEASEASDGTIVEVEDERLNVFENGALK